MYVHVPIHCDTAIHKLHIHTHIAICRHSHILYVHTLNGVPISYVDYLMRSTNYWLYGTKITNCNATILIQFSLIFYCSSTISISQYNSEHSLYNHLKLTTFLYTQTWLIFVGKSTEMSHLANCTFLAQQPHPYTIHALL